MRLILSCSRVYLPDRVWLTKIIFWKCTNILFDAHRIVEWVSMFFHRDLFGTFRTALWNSMYLQNYTHNFAQKYFFNVETFHPAAIRFLFVRGFERTPIDIILYFADQLARKKKEKLFHRRAKYFQSIAAQFFVSFPCKGTNICGYYLPQKQWTHEMD